MSPPTTAKPEGRRLPARRPFSWPGEAPIPPSAILDENFEFSVNTREKCKNIVSAPTTLRLSSIHASECAEERRSRGRPWLK